MPATNPILPRAAPRLVAAVLVSLLVASAAAQAPSPAPVTIGDKRFATLRAALAAARPGDVVLLPPVEITQGAFVETGGITIRGQPGTHFRGGPVGGKAALVVRADNVAIENIECSDMRVPDRNGACVRAEGRGLTLRNVHFHDCETGLLSNDQGGAIEVIDSRFERMGRFGFMHGIYVNGGTLTIRRSSFTATGSAGHQVKSRAALTVIEDSTIASLDAHDSRQLDASNGGLVIIRRSVMQKGPRSENEDLIGFALEGVRHADNRLTIEDSIIIFDERAATAWPIRVAPGLAAPVSRRNLIVGVDPQSWPGVGDRHFPTRAAAGLPAYPALPAPPSR